MSSPNTAALATSIAGLSVTGVTFKDITAVPKIVNGSDCPIFFPDPADWFSSMQSAANLDNPSNQADVTRVLRYIFLHSPSIAANTLSAEYSAMAGKVDLIYSALVGMSNGVATVTGIAISQFGEIEAPRVGQLRNVFFGCFFDITITEIVYK